MDLVQLRSAVAIADHGTFTRAAAALHVTQPGLSYTINRLESEIGTPLFERAPKGVRLTPAGEALVQRARVVLNEAQGIEADVAAVLGVMSGRLRLVTLRTASERMATLLGSFHELHPAVQLMLHEPCSDLEVGESVLLGRCDVGLLRRDAAPPDLHCTDVGRQQIVAAFPTSMAPDKPALTFKQLSTYPMVAMLSGTPARELQDAMFRRSGTTFDVALECEQHELVLAAVAAGVGFGLSTDNRVRALNSDQVVTRRLTPLPPNDLVLVRRTGLPHPATQAFIDFVAAQAMPDPDGFW